MSSECQECGSQLEWSYGPGRIRTYRRDKGYEIPSELVFQICRKCGAVWMTSTQIDRLSAAFEAERARRLRNESAHGDSEVVHALNGDGLTLKGLRAAGAEKFDTDQIAKAVRGSSPAARKARGDDN